MKTDSSISVRSPASRTSASGWTLLSSEIGPCTSSIIMDIWSQASSTDSGVTFSSGSRSISATLRLASARARSEAATSAEAS